MAKKQIVPRYDRTVDIGEFDAKIIDVITILQDKVIEYGPDVTLEIEYEYDGVCSVLISYEEEETDKELEKRLALGRKKREQNKRDKVSKETRERKTLERLQKKYG